MKSIITSELNIAAKDGWACVKQSKTLVYVCKGLLSFEGSDNFPEQWQENSTITTRLRFFGWIPAWHHQLRFKTVSDKSMTILTIEKGGLVKTWNHEIKFETKNSECSIYTDTVEIEAGVFTPVIWLFANVLYRYRQRRWKKLVLVKQILS